MPGKPFVTKLSSAGLIYVHFGKKLIAQLIGKPETDELTERIVSTYHKITFFSKNIPLLSYLRATLNLILQFDKVYEKFMEEVDANDNGKLHFRIIKSVHE